MNGFRSALFALFFYPVTVVAVVMALLGAPISRRVLMAVTKMWLRYHCWCAGTILGISTRVEGAIPSGTVLAAAKHQSMYETLELARLLDEPAIVLKRELADIPGWGWVARRYGVIPVDREGGAPALRRMLAAAQAAKSEGRPILIFPEGTRVAPGEQPPLQPGFAGLYRAIGAPVIPVAVNSGLLWPRKSFAKRPGIVTIRFGEALPPDLPRKEIERQVHRAINALEPRAEA